MAVIRRSVSKVNAGWGLLDLFHAQEEIRTLGDDPMLLEEIRRTAYAKAAAEFYRVRLLEAQSQLRDLQAPAEWTARTEGSLISKPKGFAAAPAPADEPRYRVIVNGREID